MSKKTTIHMRAKQKPMSELGIAKAERDALARQRNWQLKLTALGAFDGLFLCLAPPTASRKNTDEGRDSSRTT